MKFGKLQGRTPPKGKGKGGQQEMLPSRHAMSQLVGGNPYQRSLNNYAKLTPSGAGAPATYSEIEAMADDTAPLEPPG
jgi:hypothetical protein